MSHYRHTLLNRPHLDTHLAGLVDQIGIDTIAGTRNHRIGQGFEHMVIALERHGFLESVPIRAERIMGDLAGICPKHRDMFAAGGVAAVEQDHVGIFGEHLVKHGPDADLIAIIGTSGERVNEIAQFSVLRAVRQMPQLRILRPTIRTAPQHRRDIARAFKGTNAKGVTPVVDALSAIGQARRLADGRYAA